MALARPLLVLRPTGGRRRRQVQEWRVEFEIIEIEIEIDSSIWREESAIEIDSSIWREESAIEIDQSIWREEIYSSTRGSSAA
jgi:hypothetical protein